MTGNDGAKASDPQVTAHPTHPLVDAVHIVAHRAGWSVLKTPGIAQFLTLGAPYVALRNRQLTPSILIFTQRRHSFATSAL